jgi:GT2 family glycosyltransferase
MTTASIVIYKTKAEEIIPLIECLVNTILNNIYIVDNFPISKMDILLKGISTKIIYIPMQSNIGFGAAHNIAIRKALEAESTYHFIINPDIIIKENVISPMIKYMHENKNIGMMMPKVLNLDGRVQYLPKLLPSPFSILLRKMKFIPNYNRLMKKYELRDMDVVCNVPFVSGCFSLLNLELLEKLEMPGYDERFFLYFEDFDLSRRFHQKYKTIYYSLVEVYHGYGNGASKNLRLFMIFIFSAIKYFNKYGWLFDMERKKVNRQILNELHIN